MYFLGIDIGSSSIKIALIASKTGKNISTVQEPKTEMPITAAKKGWAEQDPEAWWNHICKGVQRIKKENQVTSNQISGVGIAYQMHGLVLVDDTGTLLRNSIIWCDSRAVVIGDKAFGEIGKRYCENQLLNSPANFTASKLKWVQENEPDVYARIHKIMLPGDYIAFRFSNQINTTVSGLSEGIFWDFKSDTLSKELLDYYDISEKVIPELVETFSVQSIVSEQGANESGLAAGTPILYRAGDQPNNALALNIFNPGEVAATGGTSGVMYAVTDNLSVTECARVNNFAHVNHKVGGQKRIGKLLCINGSGIQYRWLLNNLSVASYEEMNQLATDTAVGADGVCLLPFGNGAERMLGNKNVGTRILNLDLNRHHKGHLCRAALEGIAFSFVYGFEIMKSDGVVPKVIRAGNDNLFRSQIFGETIATLLGESIEIYNTTGAIGAARACILKEGDYDTFTSFLSNDHIATFTPLNNASAYETAYQAWKKELQLITKE